MGIFQDRFWNVPRKQNPWNGPYQAQFTTRDKDKIVLKLTREAEGEWRFHILEKTLTLTADSSEILVSYAYRVHENKLSSSLLTPWVVNGFIVPGEENKIFLPLPEGVRQIHYNPTAPPFHQDFFYNPPRGWMAVLGKNSKAGLGKGRACYLNIPISKYVQAREKQSPPLRERLRALFAWAGIKPAVMVTAPDGSLVPQLTTFRYIAGNATVIGCVMDEADPHPARVTFPSAGHLYDVRHGKYLGQGKAFDITLAAKDGLILALLPERPTDITVAPAAAKPGELAKVNVAIPTGANDLHVFRIEVKSPEGKERNELSQNLLASSGKAIVEIPIALNDPPGEYRVTVRDVLTGMKAAGAVTVKP